MSSFAARHRFVIFGSIIAMLNLCIYIICLHTTASHDQTNYEIAALVFSLVSVAEVPMLICYKVRYKSDKNIPRIETMAFGGLLWMGIVIAVLLSIRAGQDSGLCKDFSRLSGACGGAGPGLVVFALLASWVAPILASVGLFMHVREGMWHVQKVAPRPLYLSGNREKGSDVETYPAPWNQFDTVPLDDSVPTVSYRHMGA